MTHSFFISKKRTTSLIASSAVAIAFAQHSNYSEKTNKKTYYFKVPSVCARFVLKTFDMASN